MGSSRKHRDKERDTKEKHRSRSRSKSKERSDKYEKSHRTSHHHKDKDTNSGSRKRQRTDNSDEERIERRTERTDKKVKVKEVKDVSKTSNSSVNKNVKLDQKCSEESDRTNRKDGQQNKEDDIRTETSNTESLSIEETNKLRLKLGLKPLEVNDSEDKPKLGTDTNEIFVKTENISNKLEAQKLKDKIETQRNKRKIIEKLKRIKGLAESDSEEEEVSKWVLKNRQIEEEKAKAYKRAQLLQEMDDEFGVSSLIDDEIKKKKAKAYSNKDLKGLTVGHNTEEFREGQQMILTIKDKEVLNEEEDVLENVDLIDQQKANKNIENKAKRPDYRPYDDPEFDEFGILKKKSLLSKYDEEIEGPKKESFKLGFSAEDRQKEIEMIQMKLKQEEGRISLIVPKPQIATEYYTEEEMVKFKKPKKVRKSLRKKDSNLDNELEVFTDLISSSDHGSRKGQNKESVIESIKEEPIEQIKRSKFEKIQKPKVVLKVIETQEMFDPKDQDLSGIVLEEDDADKELQMALHKSRKLKLRDNLEATTGAASIAKVAQTIKSLNNENNENEDSNDSETFVSNNIILNSTAEFCRNLGDIPTYGLAGNRDDEQQLMDLDEDINEEKVTDSEPNRGQWNEVDIEEEEVPNDLEDNEGQPILEEEPDVTKGLAGALQLAMKKGYLDKEVKKQGGATRQSALEAQSYTIEEKFYEDDKIGRRERYNGPVSEFREKYEYKPDIKLDYVDEKGRALDPKEAFRYLSHKFHGKGPSKNKIDKRMKKKDQESKLRQMSSTDTPLNTLKMLTEKQKELQTPYIVLTGGQKTSLQNTISKTK